MFPAVLKEAARRMRTEAISVLFPLYCVSCGREGAWCCAECEAFLPGTAVLACPGCEKPAVGGRTCARCSGKIPLDGLVAGASYANPSVRALVRALKFDGAKDALPYLSRASLHGRGVVSAVLPGAIVVPVPLYRKRELARGYNQARLIAETLFPDFAQEPGAFLRVKATKAQTDLDEETRKQNPAGAFRAARGFSGKNILLVDDVYTTGATMNECARVLKEAGATEVWGFVVARG